MITWLVVGIVLLGVIFLWLGPRWRLGCGLSLLGAILGGGIAFGSGWYYLTYVYVKPRPRNDMDFSGIEVPIVCVFLLPVLGVVMGILLGVGCSFFILSRLRPVAQEPPAKLDPLE